MTINTFRKAKCSLAGGFLQSQEFLYKQKKSYASFSSGVVRIVLETCRVMSLGGKYTEEGVEMTKELITSNWLQLGKSD